MQSELTDKKSRRPKTVIVQIRVADPLFCRELTSALTAAGLSVEDLAAPPTNGALIVRVLDEPPLTPSFGQSVILPVSTDTIVAAVQLAMQGTLELDALRCEVDKLRALLNEEQTVSIAVGMLAERFQLAPVDAYKRLRRHARDTQVKLQSIGAQLVTNASSANQLFRTIMASMESPKMRSQTSN